MLKDIKLGSIENLSRFFKFFYYYLFVFFFWRGELAVKDHEGIFWDAENILCLNTFMNYEVTSFVKTFEYIMICTFHCI